MLSKKEIKDIQSLHHKKFRQETGLFVAEGPKMVAELIQLVPGQVLKIYALQDWASQNEANLAHMSVTIIDEKILEKISHLHTPNEVLALVKQFPYQVPSAEKDFCIYLDALQDPGNFGTIIRIADWFQIPHVVCSRGCADVYNPKVVQSTMASIARVNVYYDEEEQWLQQQNAPVYAAALNGSSVYECSATGNGVLIIGNESKGIRPAFMNRATEKITIPRKGGAESLNAAVATGIILSHLTASHS